MSRPKIPSVDEIANMLKSEHIRLEHLQHFRGTQVSLWWTGEAWEVAGKYVQLNHPDAISYGEVQLVNNTSSTHDYKMSARRLWTAVKMR